jgi:hypothetical protein
MYILTAIDKSDKQKNHSISAIILVPCSGMTWEY